MEGKKFSSSKGVVIYVKDFLARYQADALRYYISAAGPENQDADFTWEDFYQRTNSELVAGWGNLVNRVANMIAKNFGEIPAAGELEQIDTDLLEAIRSGYATVGELISTHHQKQALTTLMELVGRANKYVADTEPFKLKGDVLGSEEATRARLATVLNTLANAVYNLYIMLSFFLPHSANEIDQIYGGIGNLAPLPRREEVTDLDDLNRNYPIITGDYRLGETLRAWEWAEAPVGAPVTKPQPVFTKLVPEGLEAEMQRLEEDFN
jgi:methionyl-tRNA synthetase